jgi:hypothetical protein
MIRVAHSTLNLGGVRKCQDKVREALLTDEGMWAVVVAEGLEIFWALRKGEGCLGGMGPVTAAIEGEGRDRYRWVEKVGDRAIEGRGEASMNGNKWGAWLLIEKKGEGREGNEGARGTEPSHGEAIFFFLA